VAVNKADGDQQTLAATTAAQYDSALSLVRPKPGMVNRAPVVTCSALTGHGLADLWKAVFDLHSELASSGHLATKRRRQMEGHLENEIQSLLFQRAQMSELFTDLHDQLVADVGNGTRSVAGAARTLMEALAT